MIELSLNILDIANNSVRANAALIEIEVRINRNEDSLTIKISDNGCGMSKEQLSRVEDPFFTTRTTRSVGLGIPFFRQEAIGTGGSFKLESVLGKGTIVTAVFGLSHIDRMPLGDINSTIYTLIITNTQLDFLYTYELDGNQFILDTRELRQILGDIPLDAPQVTAYIKDYLKENQNEVDNGYQA
ncbi:MAG TPA: ATP-binding protein [Mobilitalea sp.]|nr:ATP-binding protein [Mobilitalea sp.]